MKLRRRPFGPTVEKPNQNPFLTEEPVQALRTGNYNQVPVIIGYCEKEGNLCEAFANLDGRQPVHTDFSEVIPYDLGLNKDSEEAKGVAMKIKEFYYKDDTNTPQNFSTVGITIALA